MKRFEHYILTRFNTMLMPDGMLYDDTAKANKWMTARMKHFKETKKSVLSQEGDFKWVISVDKRTPERFVKQMEDDKVIITNDDIRNVFLSGEIQPQVDWVITTRFDCDDRYLPGAILAIQEEFEPKLKVIDMNFKKLDYETGKFYPAVWKWQNSPFISLCEPSDRVLTAFCRPHGQVWAGYPSGKLTGTYPAGKVLITIDRMRIDDILAVQVCHDANLANKIDKKEG